MPTALGRGGAELVDRRGRYRLSSVVVERVGAVLHLDGDLAQAEPPDLGFRCVYDLPTGANSHA
jgi:hypothetical protein